MNESKNSIKVKKPYDFEIQIPRIPNDIISSKQIGWKVRFKIGNAIKSTWLLVGF